MVCVKCDLKMLSVNKPKHFSFCIFVMGGIEIEIDVKLIFSAVTFRCSLNGLQHPVTNCRILPPAHRALFVAHLVSVHPNTNSAVFNYKCNHLTCALYYRNHRQHKLTITLHPFFIITFDVSYPRQPFSPNLLMS